MPNLVERFSSALKNLLLGAALRWVFGALLLLVLSMFGARTVADLLEKVPWAYVGVVAAAFFGLFLGGVLIEFRHVTRSSKLVHWLARKAPDADDMDRLDWALDLLREGKPMIQGNIAPLLEGKVLSKRIVGETTGLLQIKGDPTSSWCVLERESSIFREAKKGDKVVSLALPIGVVGHELFFLDVSETLPPATPLENES